MKWWVTWLAMWGGLQVQASEPACVLEYRKAYIELARTNDPRYQDAADVYSVYFDFTHGLTPVQSEDQRQVLEVIKSGMESGSLCTFLGYTKSKEQILNQLLAGRQK